MQRALGLDFGTTNTVLAMRDDRAGRVMPVAFPVGAETQVALRSALAVSKPFGAAPGKLDFEVGPWAIQRYIDRPDECRFIQSLKTFAASPHFQGAYLFANRYRFEDLMRVFFESVRAHAGAELRDMPQRLVIGRPVTFAGASPDADLATSRYAAALDSFGFEEILFVYEPVAAAFSFARGLQRNATVLVADFGGGTTDYSIMRFEVDGGAIRAEPLGHGGVGIAGDAFDYRIIDRTILPHLGKGSRFRSMDKILDLPMGPFADFARWNLLSVMKSSVGFKTLKQTMRFSLEPEKLQRFIDLVEDDQGYPLYKAVSEAKAELSRSTETVLRFPPLGRDFSAEIRRQTFEEWIAEDLRRMEAALDETLAAADVGDAVIDKVFLTGGTSFVPAVRAIFERRFGAERIETGDELLSIASGLALIGERDDAAAWAVGSWTKPRGQAAVRDFNQAITLPIAHP